VRLDQQLLDELDVRERCGYTRTVEQVYAQALQQPIPAILYYTRPGSEQAYAGPLSDEDTVAIIRTAVGPSGTNLEYFNNLAQRYASQDEYLARLAGLMNK
jgi:cation transport protein ChaC